MVAIKGLTIDFLDDEPTLEKAGYIFYSGFKYGVNKNVQKRIKVNQFFFVRISRHDDPCIGELVSIWKDKFRDTMLSSVRLYFLPEQTPDGRQSNHGQHEVLAASEPVILRLNDLVSWITDEVDWVTGLEVPYSSNKIDPPAFTLPFLNLINKQITLGYHNCNPHHSTNHEIDNDVKMNQVQLEQQSNEEPENQSTIVVLSYPQYCRYRAVLKKMEENYKEKENISINCKVTKSTLTLPTSLPTSPSNNQTLSTSAIVEPDKCKIYPNIRILFCRETFEHEGLLHHDLNCEHLAPKLKGRPRKRGGSSVTMNASAAKTSSHSSSSQDSDTSEENSKQDSSRVRLPRKTSATTNKVKSHEVDCAFQGNRNNVTSKYKSTTSPMSAKLAEKCLKSETEFMKQLNKFMKERNTPITRIPHLGFKKIDLFYLFTLTQKLGGYERITKQRIWKIVYDRLGGDPRSTSAATCTRRHFERLLLPFERHLNEARGIKTNRRSTRGRSISPLGSPELSTKGGEGLDDDQSIASATSMVTEERKGRRGHHRHRHRRQGVRQSKRLQQGSSSSAPATVAAASTNGSTSSATDDDESESLNSELHEEEASKSSIVDGCPVEGELVKSEESQSGQSERKIDKGSNSCSGDELSSRNGLPNQSRDESQVECKDENERKSLTCPVKSTPSPSVEDNLNCSQSERKPTSQMSAVGVEENMEIDKVSNFETTDDVKPGSSMVNLDGADEVKNDANKDLNETKGDKIELKSVNSELDGDDMKPIKSEVESKSADEISADEKVNCLKSNKCNDDDTNNDKRDKNLTTGTDDCDTDDNVEVDLNLSKSDKLSTANGAVNVDTNNAASPLSSISTLISAMDAAKQQQQVHLTREMKVESNESQTIPPVNGIKKANLNVKSNAVAATVNATVNNSLNVSLNSNVTNTTSGRPSVIHKTPLKPCVKVVPTYKDNPIDGLPKDNSLLKKPCLPPIAHAAIFLPSPWYTQQIPFTSGSSSTSSSVTKSTKLTANFTSSSLKRKVAPSSHQDSLLLPLDLTCKKRIVEVDRKVVTPKDKVTSEDTSPSTILDLSAKVRVKECKSGKNSGLQVIHNSMDSNNNINNNTNNSIHRSAHQHAANNNAVINSVPKVPKSNNSNSNSNSNSNTNSNNSNNNVNINVNYERTTLKSNSSKAAVNHQTQNQQQQQQRHVNPSPLPVSSPVAITGTTSTPKHHSSSQSNHKTISNSNRSQLIKSSPSPNALKMKDKSNHSASSVTNSGSGLKDLNQQQQHLIQTHLNGLSNHQHHQHHQRRQQQQQQQQQQPLSSHHHQAQQQHQQLPLLPPGFPFSPSELSAANRDVQSKLQSSNTLNQLRAMVTPENFALASQTIAQEIAFREMERLHPNLAKQMSSAAAVLGYPAGFHPMLNSVHRPTVPSSPSISEYNPTLPSFLPFFNSFPTAAAAGSGTQTNSNGNGSGPNMNMNAMAAAAAAALASGHFFNPAMLGQQGGVSGFSPLELLGDERFSAAAAAAAENDARWRGWFE